MAARPEQPGTAARTQSSTWGRGSVQSLPPSVLYLETRRRSGRRSPWLSADLFSLAVKDEQMSEYETGVV